MLRDGVFRETFRYTVQSIAIVAVLRAQAWRGKPDGLGSRACSPMTPARFLFLPLALISLVASAAPTARNVFIITIDGLRWQEVFTGADTAMMNRDDGGVNDNAVVGLREEFGGDTASARREKLMPFFWQTIAARGQVFGNRALNSTVQVANAEKISYPGYSELLTGRVNPLITSPLAARTATSLARVPGIARILLTATGSRVDAIALSWYERFMRSEPHVRAALVMMANFELPALLRDVPTLAVPLTLLHGSQDGYIPLAAIRTAVSRIPSAALTVVPDAGHLLHEELPMVAVTAVREALTRSGRSAIGSHQRTP